MKIIFNVFTLLIACNLLFSCNNIDKEKKIAQSFYYNLQKKSYNKIFPMIDSSTIIISPEENWKSLFEEKSKNFGRLKSFENINSYSNFKENFKITKLKFKVVFEKKTIYEILELQSLDGRDPKIIHYEYSEKDFEILKD